ncbi:hypothetical protein D7243_18685 [Stutzerimonas stutzeri]|jgi:hypothetical protein|nr:hypothetical protein [Stutzerimonas stutzeri]CEG51013.1 hypothetical protein PXNS11_140031 [Stutzerimonas xanthomarina]
MATTLIEELAMWDVELEQLTSAGDMAFRYGALRAHLDTLYRADLIDSRSAGKDRNWRTPLMLMQLTPR